MGDERIPSLGRGEPVEYNLNFADRKGCVGACAGFPDASASRRST